MGDYERRRTREIVEPIARTSLCACPTLFAAFRAFRSCWLLQIPFSNYETHGTRERINQLLVKRLDLPCPALFAAFRVFRSLLLSNRSLDYEGC